MNQMSQVGCPGHAPECCGNRLKINESPTPGPMALWPRTSAPAEHEHGMVKRNLGKAQGATHGSGGFLWEVPWGTPKSSKLAVVNGKTNGLGPLGYPYFRMTPSVQSLQVAVFCCFVGTWWTSTVWRHAFRGNFVPRPRSWLTLSLWQCGGFNWWSNYKKTIRVHQRKTSTFQY